jgi:DNA-binding FadR family transcriptional regulator
MSISAGDVIIGSEPSLAFRRRGLANHIETYLAHRILGGQLPPGSALPSQDDLVRQFGVSRAVVREAIAALAQRGLLTVHHGRSTQVTEPMMWNVLDPFLVDVLSQLGSLKNLLQDLFAVRLVVEPETAAMIALNRTSDQLRAIAEPVERLVYMSGSSPRLELIGADRDFHWQLALATGNRVLTGIVRSYQTLLWAQFGISGFSSLERIRTQHGAVYRAIEVRDTAGAREAMRIHLIDARERFFQSLAS